MAKNKVGRSKLDYYDAFMQQARLANEEAKLLQETTENFTTAQAISDVLPRAHELENKGDQLNHDVLHAIDVDFVTPFDRVDIIELTNALDDIVDGIEEVLQRLYMFNVDAMHEDAQTLAKLLTKSTGLLVSAMSDFKDFKKFGPFIERIKEVSDVEEEADVAYMEAMHRLFTSETKDPVFMMVWMDIFEHIEECADRIDETGRIMGNIILKNS